MTGIAFDQKSYIRVTTALDDLMAFVKTEHGLSEVEARAWLGAFVKDHYLPVWREMNGLDKAFAVTE